MNKNTTRKNLKFKNTTRRHTFQNNGNAENNTSLLKSPHSVPNFSFLQNLLPANHYEQEANKARRIRIENYAYPYSQQNASNVGSIMANSNSKESAFAKLNTMIPNMAPSEQKEKLDGVVGEIKRYASEAMIHHIMNKYASQGIPVEPETIKQLYSAFLRKYLKIAVSNMASVGLTAEEQTAFTQQMRKLIIKELLMKGWFEYE
jgi:hypothetical protein